MNMKPFRQFSSNLELIKIMNILVLQPINLVYFWWCDCSYFSSVSANLI